MHQPASRFNVTATFLGYHWFWLPASYASSSSLLQMVTGPMSQLHFQSGAFSSSSSSSSLPGSMQEHMRCTSQPAAAMPQLHLWAIIGSGYHPAMRATLPCCRCSRGPVCGPSLVLATSQLFEQPFLAPDVHGTHATVTFSKRRLLLLLLLLSLIHI